MKRSQTKIRPDHVWPFLIAKCSLDQIAAILECDKSKFRRLFFRRKFLKAVTDRVNARNCAMNTKIWQLALSKTNVRLLVLLYEKYIIPLDAQGGTGAEIEEIASKSLTPEQSLQQVLDRHHELASMLIKAGILHEKLSLDVLQATLAGTAIVGTRKC